MLPLRMRVVVHLAYVNGTKNFYEHPVKILEIAIKGIVNVIEACIKNKIKEIYLPQVLRLITHHLKFPQMKKRCSKYLIFIIQDIHMGEENINRANGHSLRKKIF